MNPLVKKVRIEIVDVLRGFAIMAIMLLHNIERFNLYVFPGGWGGMTDLDRSIWDKMFFLFGGKTYSIFALLFGFTFYLMFTSQQRKGRDFGLRFMWRMLLLALFACANAAFFPGEVLMLYAVVGVILFLVRKLENKWVLGLAILFLLQPVELYHFFRSLFDAGYELPRKISSGMHGMVRSYVNEGTLLGLIKGNLGIGQAWSMLWAIENGRFVQTAGLFLMGLLIGRWGWFVDTIQNRKKWLIVLGVSSVLCIGIYQLRIPFFENREFIYRGSIGVALDMWWKLSFTFIWLSALTLLYQLKVVKIIFWPFKAYGRMSLTNYVTQSIIGSVLYFTFGFNLAPILTVTESFLLGIGLFIVQISFCNWWIPKFKQGPLEKLWHKLTWLRSN